MKQERKQLIDYWKVTHGSKFSLLVTKRKVRIMRGSLLTEYQKFVDRDPLAPKRLGFLAMVCSRNDQRSRGSWKENCRAVMR